MSNQKHQIKTRISLRRDSLQNWNSLSNQVLLPGEIAIVVDSGGNENLKIGNGLSSFSQLPYLYQNELKTEKVVAREITAKSISQGYNVKSTPTSLATGIFTEASANFDVVHGIEANVSDDYAFVFNGVNYPDINTRYHSHGEGTFNVNTPRGLSDFYVGEESLARTLEGGFVRLSSSTVQNLSTDLDMQGFLKVGGITVEGRKKKYVEITISLLSIELQSTTNIGQAYMLISNDTSRGYVKGHTYLLTSDSETGNMIYEDISYIDEIAAANQVLAQALEGN